MTEGTKTVECVSVADDNGLNPEWISEVKIAASEGRMYIAPCRLGEQLFKVVVKNSLDKPGQAWFAYVRVIRLSKSNFFNVIEEFGKSVFYTREEAEVVLESVRKEVGLIKDD